MASGSGIPGVIIGLGENDTGNESRYKALKTACEKYNAITKIISEDIYYNTSYLSAINHIITDVFDANNVDEKLIYAVGVSQGGLQILCYMCEHQYDTRRIAYVVTCGAGDRVKQAEYSVEINTNSPLASQLSGNLYYSSKESTVDSKQTLEFKKNCTHVFSTDMVWTNDHTVVCNQLNNLESVFEEMFTAKLPEEVYHTVTFIDGYDGTVLTSQSIKHGSTCNPPTTLPTHYGYEFSYWNPSEDTKITSDIALTAVYNKLSYIVSYYQKNENNTYTEKSQEFVKYKDTPKNVPALNSLTHPTGMSAAYWVYNYPTGERIDPNTTQITADCIFYAYYRAISSTVDFIDYDGTNLCSQVVEYGKDAIPPPNPTRAGYTFISWNPSYKNISTDTSCYAIYKSGLTFYHGLDKINKIFYNNHYYQILSVYKGNTLIYPLQCNEYTTIKTISISHIDIRHISNDSHQKIYINTED